MNSRMRGHFLGKGQPRDEDNILTFVHELFTGLSRAFFAQLIFFPAPQPRPRNSTNPVHKKVAKKGRPERRGRPLITFKSYTS